jgi:hypothetical protein
MAVESNVVQFPRDWLGPRSELVPFGTPEPDEQHPDGQPDDKLADFWGEGTVSLHTPAISTETPGPGRFAFPPARRLAPAVLLATALLIGLGLIVALLGSQPTVGTTHAARTTSRARPSTLALTAARPQHPRLERQVSRARTRAHAKRSPAATSSARSSSEVTPVSYHTPAYQSGAASNVESTSAGSAAGTSSESAPAHESSPPAGPIGAGAPFAPGHLG